MKRVFPWITLAVAAYAANALVFKLPLGTILIVWTGTAVSLSLSEALIGGAELLLLAELLLATSSFEWPTNANHILSVLLWAACIALFAAVPAFRTSTFALITLSSAIDVLVGIWVTLRLAPRYVAVDRSLPGPHGVR